MEIDSKLSLTLLLSAARTAPSALIEAWKTGQMLAATVTAAEPPDPARPSQPGIPQTNAQGRPPAPVIVPATGAPMEIQSPTPVSQPQPLLTIAPKALSSLIESWRNGQILEAKVIAADTRHALVRLLIGATQVNARSAVPLESGQRIFLRPEQSAEGHWQLRLVSPPEPVVIAEALRRTLPRQEPLAKNLPALARAAASPQLPPVVKAALIRLVQDIKPATELATAQNLARALVNSGLFLETKLARSPSGVPPAGDLKAALLRLLPLLRTNHPGEPGQKTAGGETPDVPEVLRSLERQVESALARIELNQLRSLPEQPDNPPSLVLEIPFRTAQGMETVDLQIRRDTVPAEDGKPTAQWTVVLELGEGEDRLRIVVALEGQKVSTRFFALSATVTERIQAHLPRLGARLKEAGLEPGTLEAQTGAATAPSALPPSHGLLRERV